MKTRGEQRKSASTGRMRETRSNPADKPSFAGGVQAEVKISESQTGEVIGAAIDRRVGSKTLTKGTDSWADVKNAMDFWALQSAYRACMITHGIECVMPKP